MPASITRDGGTLNGALPSITTPVATANLGGGSLLPDLSSLFSSSDTTDFGPIFQTLLAMSKQQQSPLQSMLFSGIKL